MEIFILLVKIHMFIAATIVALHYYLHIVIGNYITAYNKVLLVGIVMIAVLPIINIRTLLILMKITIIFLSLVIVKKLYGTKG